MADLIKPKSEAQTGCVDPSEPTQTAPGYTFTDRVDPTKPEVRILMAPFILINYYYIFTLYSGLSCK